MHNWYKGMEGVTRVRPACKRDCPNRSYDCHTKCDTYIKYRNECDAEMDRRVFERDVVGAIADTHERLRKARKIK